MNAAEEYSEEESAVIDAELARLILGHRYAAGRPELLVTALSWPSAVRAVKQMQDAMQQVAVSITEAGENAARLLRRRR